jgi:hypothetical protein
MDLWKNGAMKTTIELPDELARRVKLRAVERDQKLKDTVAQLLEIGLANAPDHTARKNVPKPVQLKTMGPLTIADIEIAISDGRQ